MADDAGTETSDSGASDAAASSYTERLGKASKWATSALGAVATTAVAKLGLDKLGTGELDTALVRWAYAGLVLFTAGVLAIIAAAVWHQRAGRVTLGYLLSNTRVARKIESFFNENSYFLGGAPNLRAFRDEMNGLIAVLRTRKLTDDEKRRLDQLLASRASIIETGAREQAREVSKGATAVLAAGALAATVGAATFALATNRDVALRNDRLAQEERERALVIAGSLLPRTPADVRVTLPRSAQTQVSRVVGEKCDMATLDAILLEVANPPQDGAVPEAGGRRNVFHVVTEREPTCAVEDLWVRPGWVTPRPARSEEAVVVSGE